MWRDIKAFLISLLYENGEPSLTRVLSMLFALAFLTGTAYLLLMGITWAHYDAFATATVGGTGAQIANKLINSKYNSPTGQMPDKGNGGK